VAAPGFSGCVVGGFLAHEDLRLSLALDATMPLSVAGRAAPPQMVAPTAVLHGTTPLVAPRPSPLPRMYDPAPPVMPPGVAVPAMPPPVVFPPPMAPASVVTPSVEPLMLYKLKDLKAFIDNWDLIQYYLCVPDFSTGRKDEALITDSTNLDASQMWEGQLQLAVKNGLLCYLFKNKCDIYNGCGFEMLVALSQHCHPDSAADASTLLLLIFNDVQQNNKPILQYWSCFDGYIMELLRCKVLIAQILLVMLFLHAIHSPYLDLLDQFCSRFKSIELANINLIVDDIVYHKGFTVHEQKPAKSPSPASSSAPRGPAAASANTDQIGTVWQTPLEWLSKAVSKKAIKTRWMRSLAGTGICPICHCEDKPWHVSTKCPLLKELNLQFKVAPPGPLAQPAVQHAEAPTPAPPSNGGPGSGQDD
jgi:hypothetical protein